MTTERANEIIAKAMGVWETPPPEKIFQGALDPDYTDPTSYLEAMAWAKKQKWWVEFVLKGLKLNMPTHLTPDESLDYMVGEVARCILDPVQGSHALASYLEGDKC